MQALKANFREWSRWGTICPHVQATDPSGSEKTGRETSVDDCADH
jgi:hypothetical protein